jgi:hypothetical protein
VTKAPREGFPKGSSSPIPRLFAIYVTLIGVEFEVAPDLTGPD